MITESVMDCLKMNLSSDNRLPRLSKHVSTELNNHVSTRLSTGLGSGTWITYADLESDFSKVEMKVYKLQFSFDNSSSQYSNGRVSKFNNVRQWLLFHKFDKR